MQTVDTYCLLPEGADLGATLIRLFLFDGVVFHDGHVDHDVRSGPEAAKTFERLMRNGDHIRFHTSIVPDTEGGWLYRLDDASGVIGISGNAHVSAATFRRALLDAVPGGRCCTWGDQPPPMTRAEFLHAVQSPAADGRPPSEGDADRRR
jgi:hypothetical protein